MTNDDPIVDDVRQTRTRLLAQAGGSISEFMRRASAEVARQGIQVVTREQLAMARRPDATAVR